jgi:hypothetical protein
MRRSPRKRSHTWMMFTFIDSLKRRGHTVKGVAGREITVAEAGLTP